MQGRSGSRAAVKAWALILAGPRRQALVVEAVASLAGARLALGLQPFSSVARRLGPFSAAAAGPPTHRSAVAEDRIARDIGWAVRSAAAWMPFRAVCLQQAIAARAMLRRRGIACNLHLGAGPGDCSALLAHAWVDAAGVEVTGYPLPAQIVEIGCFS